MSMHVNFVKYIRIHLNFNVQQKSVEVSKKSTTSHAGIIDPQNGNSFRCHDFGCSVQSIDQTVSVQRFSLARKYDCDLMTQYSTKLRLSLVDSFQENQTENSFVEFLADPFDSTTTTNNPSIYVLFICC